MIPCARVRLHVSVILLAFTLVMATRAGALPASGPKCTPIVQQSSQCHQVAKAGFVRAELTWDDHYSVEGYPQLNDNVHLRIQRRGQTRLDRDLGKRAVGEGYTGSVVLSIRRLERGSEPQVIVGVWSGGNHCCWGSLVFGFRGGHYRTIYHEGWGKWRDLDHDRLFELVGQDEAFFRFGPLAGEFGPVRIWSYRQGRFRNTTRKYPSAIKANARYAWNDYLQERVGNYAGDVRRPLAVWLADQYLLGRGESAWPKLRAAYESAGTAGCQLTGIPCGEAFFVYLRDFLDRRGYVGKSS